MTLVQEEDSQPGMSAETPLPESHQETNTDVPALSIPLVSAVAPSMTTMPGQTVDICLIPIVPKPQVRRYNRQVQVDRTYEAFPVAAGPLDCSEELATVYGWEPLTHPNGALFFYRAHKRVLTDANVRDYDTAIEIDRAVAMAYNGAETASISLDPSVELVLEFAAEGRRECWGYYFVHHERRVIFWFEAYRSVHLMNGVRGVKSKSHVKHALELQYWRHIELFPNKRILPEDMVVTIKNISMHTYAASIPTETHPMPFTPKEVASVLKLVNLLQDNTNKECEHSVSIAARFMRHICNAKFVNFYGQPSARLVASQSLYERRHTRPKYATISFRILNAIMFGSLAVHSHAVHGVWVDGTIVRSRWKNFIEELHTEWNGYTVFSTVMLVVNVSAFVVPDGQDFLFYLSNLFTVSSLLITLCLVGPVEERLRGQDVVSFMNKVSDSALGMESLAIMFSMPFTFLIWSMLAFFIALTMSIDVVPSSIAFIILGMAMFWCCIIILVVSPILGDQVSHTLWSPSTFLSDLYRRFFTTPAELPH